MSMMAPPAPAEPKPISAEELEALSELGKPCREATFIGIRELSNRHYFVYEVVPKRLEDWELKKIQDGTAPDGGYRRQIFVGLPNIRRKGRALIEKGGEA